MMGRLTDARLDRWIERELTEGLSPRRRARLHDRLRRDPKARARYDRSVAALRVFEGDCDIASSELDLVERWLADTGMGDAATESAEARRWWPAMMAAVAAALVLLWLGPITGSGSMQPWSPEFDDGWQARGPGASGGLALEVLCGPAGDDGPPALVAGDCQLSDLMGFAYRVPEDATGALTLFGVDVEGDAMFYLPTPVDPAGASIAAGRWQPLPLGVRLDVNHVPGSLRIYGLVAPSVATSDEVRTWAEALADQAPARPGDASWIERVDAEHLARLCPSTADCQAAELSLTLRP